MSGVAPRAFVGTYAAGGGEGLWSLEPRPDGDWAPGSVFEGARNASFAVRSRRHGMWYFVDEAGPGAITVCRRAGTSWKLFARLPSGGDLPCYMALDADERRLAVANYGDGRVAVFALDNAGLPISPPTIRRGEGHGPVADRQDGPHAHCVCFGREGELYHVDLGADRIHQYANAAGSAVLGDPAIAFTAPAGSGPRHLVLHPSRPFALLVSELASTLTILEIASGHLVPRATVSTLPTDFGGESLAGQLSLNAAGTRAYVTNRGHDSIAVFAWEEDDALSLLQHISSSGASPRAFALLEAEGRLILANEDGGNVAIFDLCADGTLAPRQQFALPGAAFPFVA